MTNARQTRRTRKKDAWQAAFLDALAQTGNVTESAKVASVSRVFVYERRKDDLAFAAAWDDALDQAADVMEREAWRRAVQGTTEPVYGRIGKDQDGQIGEVQKYSDTLLIFLLKAARPSKFRERTQVTNITVTPDDLAKMSDEELAQLESRLAGSD